MGEVTVKQYLTTIQKGIENELAENMKALPDGFNKQRFILNCITVLKDNLKDFNNIDPTSIASTFAKGAYLGLDFFNGECYAIPYGGTVKFQTDYKGEIKLTKKYSKNPIKDIYAKNVKEGDFFEEIIENGRQSVNFRPIPFSDKPIIGTFAVVLFRDGSMMYDTMTVAEMENTRKVFSKAQNSKAWKETPGEMYKKTVLRRLCKLIDLDFDNAEQQRAFQEGSDFDPKKEIVVNAEVVEAKDPFEMAQAREEQTLEDVDIESM
jgi:recombination protein RecT